jgi:hypothetical protein
MEGFSVTQNYEKRPHNTFGAGRRICPGWHVAEHTLFVTMARLLWAFDFRSNSDADGNVVPIDRDVMTPGLIVGPMPFEYAIPWTGCAGNAADCSLQMRYSTAEWRESRDDSEAVRRGKWEPG